MFHTKKRMSDDFGFTSPKASFGKKTKMLPNEQPNGPSIQQKYPRPPPKRNFDDFGKKNKNNLFRKNKYGIPTISVKEPRHFIKNVSVKQCYL